MFTGIVEALCPVRGLRKSATAAELALDLGDLARGVRIGESIAVNGACLTVTSLQGAVVTFDLSTETLRRTGLGDLQPGAIVNVERALRVGDRLGGHFVQGHVDGVGTIVAKTAEHGGAVIRFKVDAELADAMILKGSVAVDGVSLTIAALGPDWFEVWLIPHTLKMTTLSHKTAGAAVNIETDMIGKWVRRILADHEPGGALTMDKLREQGFA